MRRTHYIGVAAAGALALGLPSTAVQAATTAPVDVAVDFERPAGTTDEATTLETSDPPVTELTAPVNQGTAPLTTSVVTKNYGTVVTAPSRAGQGEAARLPAFDATSTGPRAVLKFVNAGTVDHLSPGARDFSWGADFQLDAVSTSAAKGSTDNGNNLVQRGLAGSGRQYKLELDGGRPACRVEGGAGALRVVLPVAVSTTEWYRATCTRVGNAVTVTLTQFDAAGATVGSWSRTQRRAGGFGKLVWGSRTVPLSAGGKLTADGRLAPASDQFNGLIDNVVVDVVD